MMKRPAHTRTGRMRAAEHEDQHSLPHEGQGIVRNDKGEEQPADHHRARHAATSPAPEDGSGSTPKPPRGPQRG